MRWGRPPLPAPLDAVALLVGPAGPLYGRSPQIRTYAQDYVVLKRGPTHPSPSAKYPYLPTDLHEIWREHAGGCVGENDGGWGAEPPIGEEGWTPKVVKLGFLPVFRT